MPKAGNDETLHSIPIGSEYQTDEFSDETRSNILIIREIHDQSIILIEMQRELKQQTSDLKSIRIIVGFIGFGVMLGFLGAIGVLFGSF